MFIFPDREKTGNSAKKYFKNLFLHREFTLTHKKSFEVFKIKGCTRAVMGCFYDLLTFVVNFELINWEIG